MTVARGKEDTFFGMDSVFNEDATVSISMQNYLKEAIETSKLDIKIHALSPYRQDLFEINESMSLLEKSESEIFHSVVAKLSHVSLLLIYLAINDSRLEKATTTT